MGNAKMQPEQLKLGQTETNLLEQVTTMERLLKAFQVVKANGGAPGVDGVTVEEFAVNVGEEVQCPAFLIFGQKGIKIC